jgi:hypothetical protein
MPMAVDPGRTHRFAFFEQALGPGRWIAHVGIETDPASGL